MKKILLLVSVLACITYGQTIQSLKGKAVNTAGEALPGLQVKMYAAAKTYTAYTEADGTFTFSNVTETEKKDILPSGYAVSNNYPNPFNPRTRIDFELPLGSNVKIEIFNAIGERVRHNVEQFFPAGSNHVDLELNGLPNGIYISRISIDGKYSVIRKMVLEYGSQHLRTGAVNSGNSVLPRMKAAGDIKIDSLVFTGSSVPKNVFVSLLPITAGTSDLGTIYVNRWLNGTPCYGQPTIVYSGKAYNTVQIGKQCWLRENLDLGNMIDSQAEQFNDGKIEKYCYANQLQSCTEYGGMYQWDEALAYKKPDGGKIQGICPEGWHIPSAGEITDLANAPEVNGNGNRLKKEGWGTKEGIGTNTSGFSAFMIGNRHVGGLFFSHGDPTAFWTTNEYDADESYDLLLSWYYNGIYTYTEFKSSGLFVRCLKD